MFVASCSVILTDYEWQAASVLVPQRLDTRRVRKPVASRATGHSVAVSATVAQPPTAQGLSDNQQDRVLIAMDFFLMGVFRFMPSVNEAEAYWDCAVISLSLLHNLSRCTTEELLDRKVAALV
jgi:hypothetical protein